MKANDFSARAKAFIVSLIRMRSYLDRTHKTKGTISFYEAEIAFLKVHLVVNGYKTDSLMAGFWIRHQDKILWLIPGKNSGSHEALMRKYQDLSAEAFSIYQQYIIQPKILNQNGNSEVRI